MFEDLEEVGITVSEDLKVEKWFACFDFEAYQRDFNSKVDEVDESQEGTSWNEVHVPVSFSVGCNVGGIETVHVLSKDPEELVSKLVDILLDMSEWKYVASVERFEEVFEELGDFIQDEKSRLEEDMVETQVDLDDLMEGNVEWDADKMGNQLANC